MPMVSMCLNYYTGAYMQISGLDLFMEARPSVRLGTAPYSVCCQKVERCVSLRWFLFLATCSFSFSFSSQLCDTKRVSCFLCRSLVATVCTCNLPARVRVTAQWKTVYVAFGCKTFLVHKLCFCDVFLCFSMRRKCSQL